MKLRERTGTVVFGLVFVAAGVGGTYSAVAGAVEMRRKAESFVAGECLVTEHEVASYEDSDGDTMFRPVVRYVHTVGAVEHRGDRIGFGGFASSMRSHAEAVLEQYPVGTRHPCWFDPQSPADAVLDRTTEGMSVAALLPLAFALVGLGVVTLGLGR